MRNLKKFLALVLAMMMTLSLMVTVNAAKTPTEFTDLDKVSPAYAEAVNVLSALGIIKGDEGFRPDKPITRAEVSAMLYRIAHNDAGEAQVKIYKDYDVFPDVKSDKWYAGAVNYCANSGYLKGYPDGSFGPSKEVTGYEVLVMTLRMLGYGQNGEFEGKQGDWRLQAAMYGRRAGLTKQIKEGTLGQSAKREVVAEIMFQALQADLVEYNLLKNYYPARELLPNDEPTRHAYKGAIDSKRLVLPLNSDLMYENYGIVGKSKNLTYDAYGRPSVVWVTDPDTDVDICSDHDTNPGTHNDAEKYVPNAALEAAANQSLKVKLTPAATYTNAVTECQVAKDVTGDESVDWKNIAEVLNGNVETNFATGTPFGASMTYTLKVDGTGLTNASADHDNDETMDALHTSDKWIGATGRTTEIYDVSDYTLNDDTAVTPNKQSYVFVYVDTYLAKVTEITEAVKDPNGHVIKPATATVKIGTNAAGSDALVTLSLDSATSREVGELVLVQTPNGGATTAIDGIDEVEKGEKVPAVPADVPKTAGNFVEDDCTLLPNKTETRRVTIKATVGIQDEKMGIITDGGDTLYASNTFLAAKNTNNPTVLKEWYDVVVPGKGITNSMIGRTYDVVLDHHGYIVGMKEVKTINSNVGVITNFDSYRVGVGQYLTAVEAYMSDGTIQVFNVVDMTAGEVAKIGDGNATTNPDTSKFKLFDSSANADNAWNTTDGVYGGTTAKLGKGSLVMFKQCKVGNVDAWYFADRSLTAKTTTMLDKDGAAVDYTNAVGTALAKDASFKTGVALTLGLTLDLDNSGGQGTMISDQLDNKSVVFVAEPDYSYNTGTGNEGDNTLKYNVHQGFKKMPTINAANNVADNASNILYQQLDDNPEYVLVYPQASNREYIIKDQETITVDDSYLVLSRIATYDKYSEYNVLKNGKLDKLQVSNSNDSLNLKIEAAMAAGDLLVVTGRSGNNVIAAETVETLANTATSPLNDVAIANCGTVMSAATHPNPLVSGAATTLFTETDGVINFNDTQADKALTLADNCTIQLVNLGTGAVKDISMGVAKVYINNDGGDLPNYSDFTFELDQYGYVCSLYIIEPEVV